MARTDRTTLLEVLEGATEFSSEPEMNSRELVRLLKSQPQFWTVLRDGCAAAPAFGNRRLPGHWDLAYLAHVYSRTPDIEPWWRESAEELWLECGFTEKPSYHVTWENFTRLEHDEDPWLDAATGLITHADAQSGGKVSRDIVHDSTEAHTNARMVHDCDEHEECRYERLAEERERKREQERGRRPGDAVRAVRQMRAAERRSRRNRAPGRTPNGKSEAGIRSADEPNQTAQGERQEKAAKPFDFEDSALMGDAVDAQRDPHSGALRLRINGCWWRCLDPTAGARAYKKNGEVVKFWTGYLNGKWCSMTFGTPVAIKVASASEQEYNSYDEGLDRVIRALGGKRPRSVVGDKGLSISKVYERNTREGIFSVFHYRGTAESRREKDTEERDRHGIPRCAGCGGETNFVRFSPGGTSNPNPRLWFKCKTPQPETNDVCGRVQSRYCGEEWPDRHRAGKDYRFLLPLWRNTELYMSLRDHNLNFERIHHHFRQRYNVGANDTVHRPKRRGIKWQQLRANAAVVIEWLLILWREGWLGSARRNKGAYITLDGAGALAKLTRARQRHNLHLPYGSAWNRIYAARAEARLNRGRRAHGGGFNRAGP